MHLKKSKFAVFCLLFSAIQSFGQNVQFVNKVFEYKPAPGQFINTPLGCPAASLSIIGENNGGVSLGAYGGYIVLGFEHPIENSPNNPYGIDFTVFGNANQSSSEPGAVYVMSDHNNNGLPDDTWFLLAGSDYWFNSGSKNYELTYFNPNTNAAFNINWIDNQGVEGSILTNEFHLQPYYPATDSFPNIANDSYKLSGLKIVDRLDKDLLDYITTYPVPFGFADNHPRNNSYTGWEPDNPYTTAIEGTGADAFDISWAIDNEGNYVDLESINFIKIQTAVNAMAGWLGEISTEVTGVVDVAPDATLIGNDKLLAIEPAVPPLTQGDEIKLNVLAFQKGCLLPETIIKYTSLNTAVATVNVQGVVHAVAEGACYIKAAWDINPEISDSIQIKVYSVNGIGDNYFADFQLYPNPVNDFLQLKATQCFTKYYIYDALGNFLTEGEITNNLIDMSKLCKGLYIIDFKGSAMHICKKVVKH